METTPIKYEKLDTSDGFINPTWYRSNMGKDFIVTVNDGRVEVAGELLRGCPYPDGTEVYVQIGRNFLCCKKSDHDRQLEEQRMVRKEKDEQYRIMKNKWRDDANVFNSTLTLPFKWDVARKDVLSGLTENSMGNGYNKSTVHHILLLEDFSLGRLKRNKDSYLCSSSIYDHGKNYAGTNSEPVRVHDGDNQPFIPKVTCKSCLAIAERLKNKSTTK